MQFSVITKSVFQNTQIDIYRKGRNHVGIYFYGNIRLNLAFNVVKFY